MAVVFIRESCFANEKDTWDEPCNIRSRVAREGEREGETRGFSPALQYKSQAKKKGIRWV